MSATSSSGRTARFLKKSIDRIVERKDFLLFAAKSAHQWEHELAEAHVPASTVLRLPEVLEHPQLGHRTFLQDVTPSGFESPLRVFNAAYGASEDGPKVDRPPPTVGQHTDEVLRELDFADAEIETLRQEEAI